MKDQISKIRLLKGLVIKSLSINIQIWMKYSIVQVLQIVSSIFINTLSSTKSRMNQYLSGELILFHDNSYILIFLLDFHFYSHKI